MSGSVPWFYRNPDYQNEGLADGDDLTHPATHNYGWIDCEKAKIVHFHLVWTAVASTAGSFAVEMAAGDKTADPVELDSADVKVHGNSGSLTIGATAGKMILSVKNPSAKLRLNYTSTGGGGDGQLSATVERRTQ